MNYKPLYATLAGRVDDAVTILEGMVEGQNFDWFHIIQVAEMLKAALLEAEEAYIEGAEETESRVYILPQSTTVPIETADRA